MQAEQLSGSLPPLDLGVGVLTDIVKNAKPLVEAAQALRRGPQRTLDVDIDLGGGRRLSGTVGDVWGNNARGGVVLQPRRQAPAGRLDQRARAGGGPARRELDRPHDRQAPLRAARSQQVGPLAQHEAEQWLRDLVALYDAGQREPLPLPVKTSLAWAEEFRRVRGGSDGDPDAQGPRRVGDAALQRLRLPQGGRRRVARARVRRACRLRRCWPRPAAPARTGPHRLGHFAWRLWSPLIDAGHEQIRGS